MRRAALALIFILTLLQLATVEAPPSAKLIVVVRDYLRNRPLPNATLEIQLQLDGMYETFKTKVNEVGIAVISLEFPPGEAYLSGVRVMPLPAGNSSLPLMPVRIADTLLEAVDREAVLETPGNSTRLEGLKIPLALGRTGNATVVQCLVWLSPGRLVNVSRVDPLTGRPVNIKVSPSARVSSTNQLSTYLVPLGYPVVVRAETGIPSAQEMRFWIDNGTSMLNWSYEAARLLVKDTFTGLGDYVSRLDVVGYPVEEILVDLKALEAMSDQALTLFREGNLSLGVEYLKSFMNGVDDVRARVRSSFQLASLVAVATLILTLAFSHIVAVIVAEKRRLFEIVRLSLLLALLGLMTLFSPTFRLASAGLLEALGVPLAVIDMPTLAAGIVSMGLLAYSLLILASLAAGPVRGFWLYLALRYLKSKRLRSVLVLLTLTLVIASTITIVGFRAGLTPIVTEERGRGYYGLDLEVNMVRRPNGLRPGEVEWIASLVNASEVGRMGVVPLTYAGVVVRSPQHNIPVLFNIVALDVEFFSKHFNIGAHVYEGRLPWSDELAMIVPRSYENFLKIGDKVYLVYASRSPTGLPVPVEMVVEQMFRVVGYYDPVSLNSTLDPEGRALFGDLTSLYTTLIIPYRPVSTRVATSRVMLLTDNKTSLERAAQLVPLVIPSRLNLLEGGRVLSYERVMVFRFSGVEALILLVFAALMNTVFMLGHVEDRRRDIEMLAVLGADPKNLFYLMMVEAVIIGVVSSFSGWLIAPAVNYLMDVLVAAAGGGVAHAMVMPVETIVIATVMGLLVSIVSTYLPMRRMREVSLMGRRAHKVISQEDMRIVGGMVHYELPIRISVFETELLYRYLKEILPRKDIMGEEVYLDGTFSISFALLPPHQRGSMVICRLRSIKQGDTVFLRLEVPEEYKSYIYLSDVVYALEKKLLGFSQWRERQVRYQILRRAPGREVLSLDDLLERADAIMSRVRETELKMEKLEEMKATITPALYSEYDKKYRAAINQLIRELLTLSLRLEPFVSQLREEIGRLQATLEKYEVAKELGEITEGEYEEATAPIREQLDSHRRRLSMIEKVTSFLQSRRR